MKQINRIINGLAISAASTVCAFSQSQSDWQAPDIGKLSDDKFNAVRSDEQAFDVAAYVNSQPRPVKPNLGADFPARNNRPVDAAFSAIHAGLLGRPAQVRSVEADYGGAGKRRVSGQMRARRANIVPVFPKSLGAASDDMPRTCVGRQQAST